MSFEGDDSSAVINGWLEFPSGSATRSATKVGWATGSRVGNTRGLLMDAIRRAHVGELGVAVIVVDAKNDRAAPFYEHHSIPLHSAKSRT